jgi:hypothetical protein
MPNLFAFVMLALWPLPVLASYKSNPAPTAMIFAFVGAIMLLPNGVGFDLPAIPRMDKESLTALMSVIACLIWYPQRLRAARAGTSLYGVLCAIFVIGGFITVFLNDDMLFYGTTALRALTWYDAVSYALLHFLTIFVPFYIGRGCVRTPEDYRNMIRALTTAALLYSLPALYESRFSPQLHRWIYGFHQGQFGMEKREGSYRANVFFPCGLALAHFFACATTLTASLARAHIPYRRRSAWIPAGYLLFVLLMMKSAAAIIFGLVAVLAILLLQPRRQVMLAAFLGLYVLFFPLARMSDWVPTEKLLGWAETIMSEQRAASLHFRFDNEDLLLEKFHQRPVFGWGSSRRNRIFDDSGKDISVTDGAWIITAGQFGSVGYAALFGLIVLPILMALLKLPRLVSPEDKRCVAGMAFVVAICAVDLIPNGIFSYFPFFFAGCLVGMTEGLSHVAAVRAQRVAPGSATSLPPSPGGRFERT